MLAPPVTAGRAIDLLVAADVLVETTGQKRDRSFVYRSHLDRLRTGTELDGARRWQHTTHGA